MKRNDSLDATEQQNKYMAQNDKVGPKTIIKNGVKRKQVAFTGVNFTYYLYKGYTNSDLITGNGTHLVLTAHLDPISWYIYGTTVTWKAQKRLPQIRIYMLLPFGKLT